jgi:chromosome segregation ATPase
MSETDTQTEQAATETDYKALYEKEQALSTKWEKYAKANLEKAKKFDAITADLDKANEHTATVEQRLKALEDENNALRARETRAKAVREIAVNSGLPEAVVSSLEGNNADELAAAAKVVAAAIKAPSAPFVGSDGSAPTETAKPKGTAEQFAQAFREHFDK